MELLHIFDMLPSTNDHAKLLAKQGAPHGTAVLAKRQSAGRGRMGRTFLSPEGGLYLSVILRPSESAEELMALTTVLAAAACPVLEEVAGLTVEIKWTNDLVVRGKKLAGILTELSLKPDGRVDFAVCGIGVNCNTRMEDLDPEIREMATSLLAETGMVTDVEQLARKLAEALATAALQMGNSTWLEDYRRRCVTLGKQVRVLGQVPYEAEALDVDAQGALVVRKADGSLERIFSGEVSVRGLWGYV